jgi:hypothetical protein
MPTHRRSEDPSTRACRIACGHRGGSPAIVCHLSKLSLCRLRPVSLIAIELRLDPITLPADRRHPLKLPRCPARVVARSLSDPARQTGGASVNVTSRKSYENRSELFRYSPCTHYFPPVIFQSVVRPNENKLRHRYRGCGKPVKRM